jgi:hypothetical protein
LYSKPSIEKLGFSIFTICSICPVTFPSKDATVDVTRRGNDTAEFFESWYTLCGLETFHSIGLVSLLELLTRFLVR